MEFSFNINSLLKDKITKIRSNLLADGFSGDRRSSWDHVSKISDILDEMGRASAIAQGLQKAITSAERLRNSDHTIYLLIDPDGKGGEGIVVGLLKVGRKKLFVFDAAGAHHEMQPLCILDFYVHESKQRMGCGKTLYEYMLKEEETSPQYLAIDRPSEKFLGFLYKHYGLDKILPQTNNFVVFEGFFTNNPDQEDNNRSTLIQTRSANHIPSEVQRRHTVRSSSADERYNALQPSLYGRYAAHRPPSTIGKILQSVGHHRQSNGDTSQLLPHFGIGLAYEAPFSASDGNIQDVCKSPKSFVMELDNEVNSSPPASCRLYHCTAPVKRDLKFSHSPLW